MASTRLYLDLRGKAKDGKGSILIVICHNQTTSTVPTGIRIEPSCWDRKGQRVIKLQGHEAINAQLQEKKSKIDKAIALLSLEESFPIQTAAELKNSIPEYTTNKISGHLLSSLFTEYMENGNLKEGTKYIYRVTAGKIMSFAGEKAKIEDVNLKWLRSFEQFLAQTQGINGRSIYLRAFRAVCNYAKSNRIVFSYPFDNFKIKSEPTRKRSVPVELLRKFYSYPTTPENQKYRDYFFLMFFLIGINTKDILLAKKSQIADGRLEYVREKTRKKYSIKIEPEAEFFLKKYEGKGDYLLEAMDHCKHYRSFAHEINDALKTIGESFTEETYDDNLFGEPRRTQKVNPVIPDITTYYARHCWATLAYEIEIPLDIISQALGHSFGNRTTLIYVKPDREKVDAANRKVIDYLLNSHG